MTSSKHSRLLRLCACLALAVLFSGVARAETLRLRNGAFLVGKIENPDENGFLFTRFRDGGKLRIGWEDLVARDAARLRASFQLVDGSDGDVVTFRALRILRAQTGAAPKEIIGELVAQDGKRLTLRVKGNTLDIPVASLRGTPQYVDVPIRDVLTPDEIYRRKLAEVAPEADADKHVVLADYLIRVEDLERAKEHLVKGQELGGGSQPNKIAGMLERVEKLLANKAEADLLREITIASNRNRFPKALELIEDFAKKFPNSKLQQEYERRKELVAKARERYYIKVVTADWYRLAREHAKIIARDRQLGVEEARVQAAEQMGQKIREAIARTRRIKVEEADEMFKRRFEFPSIPKIQLATYGFGSWLLGEKDLIAGTAHEKLANKDQPKASEEAERVRRELEKRLREFQRRRGGARTGPNTEQEQKLESPDEWWKGANSRERASFILATYAERSGDMQVDTASLHDCSVCAAKGRIQVPTAEAGRSAQVTCPTCHGLKYKRSIRFK